MPICVVYFGSTARLPPGNAMQPSSAAPSHPARAFESRVTGDIGRPGLRRNFRVQVKARRQIVAGEGHALHRGAKAVGPVVGQRLEFDSPASVKPLLRSGKCTRLPPGPRIAGIDGSSAWRSAWPWTGCVRRSLHPVSVAPCLTRASPRAGNAAHWSSIAGAASPAGDGSGIMRTRCIGIGIEMPDCRSAASTFCQIALRQSTS